MEKQQITTNLRKSHKDKLNRLAVSHNMTMGRYIEFMLDKVREPVTQPQLTDERKD